MLTPSDLLTDADLELQAARIHEENLRFIACTVDAHNDAPQAVESAAHASTVPAPDDWSLQSFLDSLGIVALVARALKAAIAPNEEELSFARRLDASTVTQLLCSDGKLHGAIAAAVWAGLEQLQAAQAATAKELNSKFAQGGGFELSFSNLSRYYAGLEGLIGSPHPDAMQAVETEHVSSEDSQLWYTTSNYGIETTSQIEYIFTTEGADGLRANGGASTVGLREYPREESAEHRRSPQRIDAARIEPLNAKLRMLGEPVVTLVEAIAGNLYTGPSFTKYNAVLRATSGVGALVARRDELCRGNRYTTTLHCINSLVVKCGKLGCAGCVYRGVAGARLPERFLSLIHI